MEGIVKKALQELKERENPNYSRQNLTINQQDFRELVYVYGNNYVRKTNPKGKFIVDDFNKEALSQFYYWLNCNTVKFKGDISKGVIFYGTYGTGKTVLMNVCADIYSILSGKNFVFINLMNLTTEIIENNRKIEFYQKRPLKIDEIGREAETVKSYGNERRLMEELLTARYVNNSLLMIGTTNMKLDDLRNSYGEYLGERLLEMFNFIVLPGKSRRK